MLSQMDTPLDRLANSDSKLSSDCIFLDQSFRTLYVYRSVIREHGWDYPIAQEMIRNKMEYPAISKDSQTLAEVLADAGYETR